MRIGIDISQLAYLNTGVSSYLSNLVRELIKQKDVEFVLFYSSLRRNLELEKYNLHISSNVKLKKIKIPPSILSIMWNKLHVFPIENFIGDVDILITSDWTEPPTRKAKKATILYDLTIYKSPEETDLKIIRTQKRKLKWVKQEADIVFCISNATMKDAHELLGINESKLKVLYPGI